jgi:hypothetical protein
MGANMASSRTMVVNIVGQFAGGITFAYEIRFGTQYASGYESIIMKSPMDGSNPLTQPNFPNFIVYNLLQQSKSTNSLSHWLAQPKEWIPFSTMQSLKLSHFLPGLQHRLAKKSHCWGLKEFSVVIHFTQ